MEQGMKITWLNHVCIGMICICILIRPIEVLTNDCEILIMTTQLTLAEPTGPRATGFADENLPAAMTPEELLVFTQRHRLQMVRQLTKNSTVPTADPKEARLFLDVLDAVDKTVFTQRKLAVDEGVGNATQMAIEMATQLFKDKRTTSFSNTQNFTPRENVNGPPDIDLELLPPVTLVPGEMDPLGSNESYAEFMERAKTRQTQKV